MSITLLAPLTAGCGGGGGSSAPPAPAATHQRTVQVPAGQSLQTILGVATITSGPVTIPTQVTVTDGPAPAVAQPTFQPVRPLLTISADNWPSSGITVSYPDPAPTQSGLAAVYNGSEPIGGVPVSQDGSQMSFRLDATDLPVSKSRGPNVISVLIGKISSYLAVDQNVSLTTVGSSDPTGRILIFCHGLFQQASDVMPTVLALKMSGHYGQAYNVEYDWRLPFKDVAAKLAFLLKPFQPKSVDFVGYSKGGLVGRWTLEGDGATRAVSQALFLGTPNTGCAMPARRLFSAGNTLFIKASKAMPMSFDPSDTCFTELMPGSTPLTDLNSPTHQQNGNVSYVFVAGTLTGNSDGVVSKDSALMSGDSINSHTNGAVTRVTMPNLSHFNLASPDNAVAALSHLAATQSGINISFDANPVEASSTSGAWEYVATVTNTTGHSLTLDSFEHEGFSRSGEWYGNFWYNPLSPPDTFFPQDYVAWNQTLASGDNVSLNLQTWADMGRTPVWNATSDRQAVSVNWILLAHDEAGQQYQTRAILTLTYNGATPASPHTRAAYPKRATGPIGASRGR